MPADQFFADGPAEVGLDPNKVQALMDRAERDVRDGILPACQVAIARNGKIAAMRTFGRAVQGGAEKPATNETVFVAMSCSKPSSVLRRGCLPGRRSRLRLCASARPWCSVRRERWC